MQEQWHFELFDACVERLEPVGVDAEVIADASRDADTDESQLADGVVEHVEGDRGVDQRNDARCPEAAGVPPRRTRHFVVPQYRRIAALVGGQIGEVHRKRARRAYDVHLVGKGVHVCEQVIEVEPLGAEIEASGAGVPISPVRVAAFAVALSPRVGLPLAQLIEDGPRPPMEMSVDDTHVTTPCLHMVHGNRRQQPLQIRTSRRARPAVACGLVEACDGC